MLCAYVVEQCFLSFLFVLPRPVPHAFSQGANKGVKEVEAVEGPQLFRQSGGGGCCFRVFVLHELVVTRG